MATARFLLSVDFELFWGIRDNLDLVSYRDNLLGVQQVIPRMLELCRRWDVAATFATVGLLFFDNRQEALAASPALRPTYCEPSFSPYADLENLESRGPEFFASDLIKQIRACPEHEIASHTFSHYYCMEEGQTAAQFEADLRAALSIARARGVHFKSIVLPRSQSTPKHLQICRELGFQCYRGAEPHWIYRPRPGRKAPLLLRLLRFADSCLNLTGIHSYEDREMLKGPLINLTSSYLLRGYAPALGWLKPLQLRRVRQGMTAAARQGKSYHIWCHPHSFGVYQRQNFETLEAIFSHFKFLQDRYGMRSCTMGAAAAEILSGTGF